jgi:hypothetical protein
MKGLTVSVWLSIVLPIVSVFLSVVLSAAVNKRLKFATTVEEADRDLKALAIRIVCWILNLLVAGSCVFNLYVELSSNEPLTRWLIFWIAYNITVPLFVIIAFSSAYSFRLYSKRFDNVYELLHSQLELLRSQSELIGESHKELLELTGKSFIELAEVMKKGFQIYSKPMDSNKE